ncbi:hypothetical protein [Candidatus Thioglobus sp.]|uniref:hypothetical protein n=1 Tax=Candidatus Thioglobus sp. TaxID=2026721 RepID=UPI003D0B9ED4
MNYLKWISVWFVAAIVTLLLVGTLNYIISPYNSPYRRLSEINYFSLAKLLVIKTFQVDQLEYKGLVLGGSRAEFGFSPEHDYFIKPSYNYGSPGSSVYDTKLKLKHAIKTNNIKQVVYVADYGTFILKKQSQVPKDLFADGQKYFYLFSTDTLINSFKKIFKTGAYPVLSNGQREHFHRQKNVNEAGSHAKYFAIYKDFYKGYYPAYQYQDTKKNSFDDFEELIEICYKNNIKLDVVFGPSHVVMWEILNDTISYSKWLKWKKDVVLSMQKVSDRFNKDPYRLFDFSVYHKLTTENVPTDLKAQMKYHWEPSHYKSALGEIVLNRLIGESKFKEFGVELNIDNIESHLNNQKNNRLKYISSKNQ